jgi:hypothetical protein
MNFTKLFSSITESTIWVAPDAHRICWITMLAMADRMGRVWASVPGLASRARIGVDDTRAALASFLAPDPDSRTKDHEGRRIEEIDGGWRLLNHAKYRAIRDVETTREVAREHMRRTRAKVRQQGEQFTAVRRGSHIAEAEAEAEALKSRAGRSQGKRLSADWQPSEPLKAWAAKERPDLDLANVVANFRDHWAAAAGRTAVKLDWDAAFRTWVRNERAKPGTIKPAAAAPLVGCGHCGRPISGAWSQSPKGRVCDPCWKQYHRAGTWPEPMAAAR